MNVLAVGPALLRRVLDDLAAVGRTARQLDGLRAGLLTRLDTLNEQLQRLREEIAPLQQISAVRAQIANVTAAVAPLVDNRDGIPAELRPSPALRKVPG